MKNFLPNKSQSKLRVSFNLVVLALFLCISKQYTIWYIKHVTKFAQTSNFLLKILEIHIYIYTYKMEIKYTCLLVFIPTSTSVEEYIK